jgi:hypothetical protein
VAVARGDGPQTANAPSKGAWNLYQWTAVDNAGKLPSGLERLETWVWNEGTPSDITPFNGIRVLLLGPPAVERSWNTARTFDRLRAYVRVEHTLTLEEVDNWMARFAAGAAPHP